MTNEGPGTETTRAEPVLTEKTLVYRVGSKACLAFCKLAFRMRIEGRANVPRSGGAVLAANHQSFLDIPIVGGAVSRHVAFVARDTLDDWRWLAFVMRESGVVLVRRGTSDRRALRQMADHLEAGDLVAIYPEGTRTRDGSLQEFKGGAVLAARMAKVPIVPVGIRGAFEAWPRGKSIPRPRKIGVRFGAPIDSGAPDAQEQLLASVRAMIGDGTYRSVPEIR